MNKYKLLGNIAYIFTKSIYCTMRKKVIKKSGYDSEKSYAYGYCSSKWIFTKAWDKFEIPKPFSKRIYIIGEPMVIPEDGDVDEWCKIVGNKIKELEIEAEERYRSK